jgi:hypothetical protein
MTLSVQSLALFLELDSAYWLYGVYVLVVIAGSSKLATLVHAEVQHGSHIGDTEL